MVEQWVDQVLAVDAASVGVVEFVGGLDAALNGAVLSEFRLHLLDAFHAVVLADVVLLVRHGPAVL